MSKSTTTTTTTTPKANAKAKASTRTTTPKASATRSAASSIIARVASGELTTSAALAEVTTVETGLAKASAFDTVAVLDAIGAIAIAWRKSTSAAPKANAKPEGAQAIADAFVKSEDGKAFGRQAGSVKQAIDIARTPNLNAVLNVWEGFTTSDAAKASDPKAFALSAQGFLRFAAAWKANRVNVDTGVIFATSAAAKINDPANVAAKVSAAKSQVAKVRAERVAKAKARKASVEAKASDAMIGAIRVADVAALNVKQRKALAALLASLA